MLTTKPAASRPGLSLGRLLERLLSLGRRAWRGGIRVDLGAASGRISFSPGGAQP